MSVTLGSSPALSSMLAQDPSLVGPAFASFQWSQPRRQALSHSSRTDCQKFILDRAPPLQVADGKGQPGKFCLCLVCVALPSSPPLSPSSESLPSYLGLYSARTKVGSKSIRQTYPGLPQIS